MNQLDIYTSDILDILDNILSNTDNIPDVETRDDFLEYVLTTSSNECKSFISYTQTKLFKFLKSDGTYSGVCCHWLTNIDIFIPKNIELTAKYDISKYVGENL